jgi:hypothetical protein
MNDSIQLLVYSDSKPAGFTIPEYCSLTGRAIQNVHVTAAKLEKDGLLTRDRSGKTHVWKRKGGPLEDLVTLIRYEELLINVSSAHDDAHFDNSRGFITDDQADAIQRACYWWSECMQSLNPGDNPKVNRGG